MMFCVCCARSSVYNLASFSEFDIASLSLFSILRIPFAFFVGSWVFRTSMYLSNESRCFIKRGIWLDVPEPSAPSNTMKRPFFAIDVFGLGVYNKLLWSEI